MTKKQIGNVEVAIYEYIVFFKELHCGDSPSRRDIVREVDCVNSTSHVQYCLHKLEEAGWIELEYHRPHIRIVGSKWIKTHDNSPSVGDIIN